jgi:hypothetical protein
MSYEFIIEAIRKATFEKKREKITARFTINLLERSLF